MVVIALVGLIFILLLVFILIIRGQSKKYTKKTDAGRKINVQSLLQVCYNTQGCISTFLPTTLTINNLPTVTFCNNFTAFVLILFDTSPLKCFLF